MAARILALLSLTFWGCSPSGDRIIDKKLEGARWVYPDTLWGEFRITEPASCRDIELEIHLEESYLWRNLYLMLFTVSPDGFRTQTRIQVVFSDSLGDWYVSNRKFRTFVGRNISFATVGTYRIGLLPYMRADTIPAIEKVALSVYPCSTE